MVLNGVLPVVAAIRLILEALVFEPGAIYGYMVLSLVSSVTSWIIVIGLILQERNYMLPSVARKGK